MLSTRTAGGSRLLTYAGHPRGDLNPLAPDSLLRIVSDREFLKAPIERLVTSIESRLESALPNHSGVCGRPTKWDLNDKIEGLIDTWRDDLQREHPSVPFARAGVVSRLFHRPWALAD